MASCRRTIVPKRAPLSLRKWKFLLPLGSSPVLCECVSLYVCVCVTQFEHNSPNSNMWLVHEKNFEGRIGKNCTCFSGYSSCLFQVEKVKKSEKKKAQKQIAKDHEAEQKVNAKKAAEKEARRAEAEAKKRAAQEEEHKQWKAEQERIQKEQEKKEADLKKLQAEKKKEKAVKAEKAEKAEKTKKASTPAPVEEEIVVKKVANDRSAAPAPEPKTPTNTPAEPAEQVQEVVEEIKFTTFHDFVVLFQITGKKNKKNKKKSESEATAAPASVEQVVEQPKVVTEEPHQQAAPQEKKNKKNKRKSESENVPAASETPVEPVVEVSYNQTNWGSDEITYKCLNFE